MDAREANPLRQGDDSSFLASTGVEWTSRDGGYTAGLVFDNVTNSEYQPFSGTPASGRQVTFISGYHW